MCVHLNGQHSWAKWTLDIETKVGCVPTYLLSFFFYGYPTSEAGIGGPLTMDPQLRKENYVLLSHLSSTRVAGGHYSVAIIWYVRA
jgi:hypothetical protein